MLATYLRPKSSINIELQDIAREICRQPPLRPFHYHLFLLQEHTLSQSGLYDPTETLGLGFLRPRSCEVSNRRDRLSYCRDRKSSLLISADSSPFFFPNTKQGISKYSPLDSKADRPGGSQNCPREGPHRRHGSKGRRCQRLRCMHRILLFSAYYVRNPRVLHLGPSPSSPFPWQDLLP